MIMFNYVFMYIQYILYKYIFLLYICESWGKFILQYFKQSWACDNFVTLR